jgi:hypothetical protein
MTSLRSAGTSSPDALKRLFAADPSAFSSDAVLAHATPPEDLVASRSLAAGRNEIARALMALEPHAAQPLVCIVDGSVCFVEGRLREASFAASLQLDSEGAIERALWLSSAPVAPSPTWAGDESEHSEARPIVDRYFGHLQANELREAVACFADDCLYSHPPYAGCTARVEFRGHDELLDGFENKRRSSPARQVVTAFVQRGPDSFIEGVVDRIPNGGSFLSSLSLADDGRIRRYAAWYCAPRVE